MSIGRARWSGEHFPLHLIKNLVEVSIGRAKRPGEHSPVNAFNNLIGNEHWRDQLARKAFSSKFLK